MKHYGEARLFKVVEFTIEAANPQEAEQKVKNYFDHGGINVWNYQTITEDLDRRYSLHVAAEKE